MKPILAKATRNLPNHSDIGKPISLVRLTTRSGMTLDCAAESVFGLHHMGGAPVLLPPVPPVSAKIGWDHPIITENDARFWYIAGLMIANGRYPASPSIPAQIAMPAGGRSEIEHIWDFLCTYSATLPPEILARLASTAKIAHSGDAIRLTSRLLDFVLEHGCAGAIEPRTMIADFTQISNLPRSAQDGFVAGVLRGASLNEYGKVLRHRSAPMLRALQTFLFWSYGIPTSLHFNTYHGEFAHQARNHADANRLVLLSSNFGFVTRAGLPVCDIWGLPEIFCVADPLVDVRDIGKQAAVEVRCDASQCVAGGFVFESEFAVPAEAIALATMDEVFS